MLPPGRYRVRDGWQARTTAQRTLINALISIEPDGCVTVTIAGEPLFAYPTIEKLLAHHEIDESDLQLTTA